MRILKMLLGGLVGLLALILIVSFFLSGEGDYVERSTVIDAPKENVFAQVNNLRKWEKWSPWNKDETMKLTYSDKDTGKGAKYAWTSEASGDGWLEIAESLPNESINTSIDFGFMGRGKGSWKFEDENGKTKVTWGMTPLTAASFPASIIGKYFLAFGDMEEVGVMFAEGLTNIKNITEKEKPASATYQKMMINGAEHYMVRDRVKWSDIQPFYAKHFPAIMQQITQNNRTPSGMPRGIFYVWDEENQETDMAAAIPVGVVPDWGAKKSIKLGSSEATVYDHMIVYDFYGDYEETVKGHEAIAGWLKSNGKKEGAPVMEEYVTDPTTEKDPTKWLTKIYYPYE